MRILEHEVHYHVIARCNGGERYLSEPEDRWMLLEHLKHYRDVHKCNVFQFTVIPSHIHLMLMTDSGGRMDQFMHDFCLSYARAFNKKHNRKGHFWRHNYRSKIIKNDYHALACLRYQDNNSVKAGIVKHPRDWLWSGYRFYAEGEPSEILTPHPSYALLGEKDEERRGAYRAMFDNVNIPYEYERRMFEGLYQEGSRRFDVALSSITKPIISYLGSIRNTTTKWLPDGI